MPLSSDALRLLNSVCVCVQASLFQYSVGVTCSSEEEIHINKGNIWGRCILLFLIYTQILTTN